MPVVEGSRVVTGDDGFAEIEFESGGTVRLTPGSELRVRELGLRGDHQVSMLELSNGTAYFNVKKEADDDFRVVVNGQEVRVAKSARFRIRGGRDSAEIAVTKGEVELAGSAQNVRIKKDETITLDAQDPGRYFLARNVTAGSYDAWDQERDDYRARYVATSNSYRGYSSGYSYGVSDLNYYGSYSNVAGYGYVWRPYGYDIGWDPYSDGAWVWYPGYGYTWVSGYSWGWMPYRYGNWIFISGYGWVWQPGNSWHRWRTCTAVYHPPHNYHSPTPPIHTGGGGSGGGHHGGNGSGTGGGGNGRVVVVGQGPFTGHGPGFRNDGDGNPHATGGRGQTLVTSGSGAHAPSALTPGLQPTGAVAEELRRVHGQDLGMPARVRQQSEASATTTVTTPGGTGSGTAATGDATSSGSASPSRPVQPVIVPPRPVRSSDESPVRTPNSGTTAPTMTTTTTTVTTPSRPASSYTPPQPRSAPSPSRTYSPPASSYRSNSGSSGNSGGGNSGGSASSRSTSTGSTSAPARSSSGSSHSSSHKDPK